MTIENYIAIIKNIAEIAHQCGRNPHDINLICVSKGVKIDLLLSAYKAGCRNFGESRIQEALKKVQETPKDIDWHLIGSLQKNKVKQAIQYFSMIHSVDSYELAHFISQTKLASNLKSNHSAYIKIFLQVNTSEEATKHGFKIDELRAQAKAISLLQGVKIQGLMTIAPFVESESIIRNCFRRLRLLRDELYPIFTLNDHPFKDLSMGMSNDYPIAIQEGATFLRIGTAIFKKNQ